MSIRSKVILTVVTMVLATTSLSGVMIYNKMANIESDHYHSTAVSSLDHVEHVIDQYFDSYTKSLEIVSDTMIMNNFHSDDSQALELETLFTSYLETYPDVGYIYFGSADKNFIMQPPQEELPDGITQQNAPWYTHAVESGGAVSWTETYIDAFSGEPIITAAKPVYNTSGKLLGVLAIDLNLVHIFDALSTIKIGGDMGYPILADSFGATIMHPNKELIGMEIPIPEIHEYIDKNYEGMTQYNWNGDKKIAIIRNVDSLGWKVITTIDEEYILMNVQALIMPLLLISMIIIAVSIFISTLITKDIKKR